ncbi:MAG: membrane protein insertase YidC [Alistipes sp.]|nr:membrane protein insertase YidC [Alistipes sp.]
MDKKTIIGVLLMSFIFVGYVIYSSKQQAKYQEYLAQVAEQEAAAAEAAEPEVTAEPTLGQADTTAVVDRDVEIFGATLAAARDRAAETVTMSNDYLTVELSTQGASMQKVTLAEYTKYAPREERNEKVVLYEPAPSHMALEFFIRKDLNNVPVNTSEYVFENMGVTRGEGFQKLAMRLEVAPGSYLVYEYVLYDDKTPSRDYMVDFDIKFENMSQLMANQSTLNLLWSARTYQNERGYQNENLYTTVSYRLPGEESIESLSTGNGQEQEAVQNPVNWVAFKQQFFSEALIARNNFSYADVMYVTEAEGSGYIKTFTARMGLPYDAQTAQYDMSVYCGPNKYAVLSNVVDEEGNKIAMERLIPLGGWLVGWINRWIVIPVFDFLSKYIASFGLIILILTVLIKLLIFPLTYRSYLSTAKMRVIKPEVDALNEKYPRQEDMMKKQQAMMDLYKKAGINPLGGCIPLLIQLPILWAMFRFFPASIELRGESFLWADDLSAYDSIVTLPFSIPWYGDHVSLFALLMCAALVGFSYFSYQQTASSQPQMAGMRFMMVYLMPIMMLFFFNGYASGLCYYYLLSQLITIGIMAGIRRFVDDEKIHAMIRRNAEKQKNKKKSKFQLRYEELMRQQQEQLRQQQKGRR